MMRAYISCKLKTNYLDYAMFPNSVRIQVTSCVNVVSVDDQYIVRPKKIKYLINQVKKRGLVQTLRKIISRTKERSRNMKYMSCGRGLVIDSQAGEQYINKQVVFLMPNHPQMVDNVVLPVDLVCVEEGDHFDASKIKGLCLYNSMLNEKFRLPAWVENLKGWSECSGISINKLVAGDDLRSFISICLEQVEKECATQLSCEVFPLYENYVANTDTPIVESKNFYKKSAVLYGLGNFAKTCLLPNIKSRCHVVRIHELDPLQLGPVLNKSGYSTSPAYEPGSKLYFIAGYHHTHMDTVFSALAEGADVVVEKPLLTTHAQLIKLKKLFESKVKSRIFVCYQKRYYQFNRYIFDDLNVKKNDPINYHCTVFEELLPAKHWYNWPNSRGRIVSNGCHWVDHFLFLNGYAKVTQYSAEVCTKGVYNVNISLVNGAAFTMTLTEVGSSRWGVQEYIELRAGEVTAKIINAKQYYSENGLVTLRRKRINPATVHKTMYQCIMDCVYDDSHPGDSYASLIDLSELILNLDAQILGHE